MSFPGQQNFTDRLKEQREAKLAMLERAKEKRLDPDEKDRLMKERAERNQRREEREAKKEAERKADEKRIADEKAERERKVKIAAKAKVKAQEELVRAQKARRDAKYAARKGRK